MRIITRESEYGFEAVDVNLMTVRSNLELDIISYDYEEGTEARLDKYTSLSKANVQELITTLQLAYDAMND